MRRLGSGSCNYALLVEDLTVGQAPSYMVGRLEIQRLRALAESRLGRRFDIHAFHDLVLGGGSLPLSVLDGVVVRWIEILVR